MTGRPFHQQSVPFLYRFELTSLRRECKYANSFARNPDFTGAFRVRTRYFRGAAASDPSRRPRVIRGSVA